ncbi:ribbon-helix-helix domain-containing protein [Frigidibacter oleivorans]|nr:hypothetical protein [Frigidibacter oleivorans]
MTKTLPLSFRLDPADKLALERAAAADGRSVSNLLVLIVREWLAAHPTS